MSSQEIKSECELQFHIIKEAQDRLEYLRSICPHENVFEGLWSWRIGASHNALICSDCGICVENLDILPTIKTEIQNL